MVIVPHRRLEALLFDAPIFHAGIFGNHSIHLFEHFGGRLVSPESCLPVAELLFDAPSEITDNLPIGSRLTARVQGFTHPLNAAVRVGEGAVLFRPGSGGGENTATAGPLIY